VSPGYDASASVVIFPEMGLVVAHGIPNHKVRGNCGMIQIHRREYPLRAGGSAVSVVGGFETWRMREREMDESKRQREGNNEKDCEKDGRNLYILLIVHERCLSNERLNAP